MNLKSFAHALRRSYAPAWAMLLIGLALTGTISFKLHESIRATEEARFERAVRQTTEVLQDRLQRYELALTGLADFVAARNSIGQPEWRFRIQMLAQEQNYPGLLEAGFAEVEVAPTRSAPGNSAELPATAVAPPVPSFRIAYGWARPPSAMDGVDQNFLTETEDAAAAWQSVLSSAATLGKIRQLSAEVSGKPANGFTIFIPVYQPTLGLPPTNAATLAETELAHHREQNARGVVFGAAEPRIMLERLFGTAPREISFEIFASIMPAVTNWLNRGSTASVTLKPQFHAYLRTNFPMQVFNQTWSAHFYTTPLFEQESSRSRPWLVLVLGTGLTLTVTLLLLTQIHARVRQDAIALELRAACEDLQRVQNERERVSRDLHDGAIQSLYGLQLMLGSCQRQLGAEAGPARELLARGRFGLDDLIAELRRFIVPEEPKPGQLVNLEEAKTAVQHLVQRFQSTESVVIEWTGETSAPASLTPAHLGHLKQIAQEALSNSLRHSRAKTVRVELSVTGDFMHLSVADDGQGFDPHTRAGSGNGLANMQARAAQMGGHLRVESRTGHGTRVTLVFPAKPARLSRDG